MPKEAKIYLVPDKDAGELVQHPSYPFFIPAIIAGDKYFIGVTPMTYSLPAGRYQVAILTNNFMELEWEKKAENKRQIKRFRNFKDMIEGKNTTNIEGCCIYKNKDDIEQIIFIYMDKKLIYVGKLFTIEIKPKEEKKIEL